MKYMNTVTIWFELVCLSDVLKVNPVTFVALLTLFAAINEPENILDIPKLTFGVFNPVPTLTVLHIF